MCHCFAAATDIVVAIIFGNESFLVGIDLVHLAHYTVALHACKRRCSAHALNRESIRLPLRHINKETAATGADPEVEEGGGTHIEWGWCGHAEHAARGFANV